MSFLDLKTVVLSGLALDIVCTLVLTALWRYNRKKFDGLGIWTLDFALQTTGLCLILLRGVLPDWLTIFFSNGLIIAGAWLGLLGLEKFVGRKGCHLHNYLFLAAFVAVHAWLSVFHPNLTWRSLNLAVALLFFFVQCAWLMLFRVAAPMRVFTRWTGVVFAAYSLLFLVRIAELAGHPFSSGDYFRNSGAEPPFHLLLQMLFVLLTYSMGLMVNRRLLANLRVQEEKFSKAFHSAPYAVFLTRLADGKIVEVNDGFVAIMGYAAAEVLGRTTFALDLWARPEDRAAVVARLTATGKVDAMELPFRRKSGELLTGLFSAATIVVGDEKCILASIGDITARKRAEDERARLLAEREKSLEEIRILGGLLPICMSCKKIRDDKGYWNQLELYIRTHSQAEFSHGLCPECAQKIYPEFAPDAGKPAP